MNYPEKRKINFRLFVIEGEVVRSRFSRIYWTKKLIADHYFSATGRILPAGLGKDLLLTTVTLNGVLWMILSISILTTPDG